MRLLLGVVLFFLVGATVSEARAAVEVKMRHPVSEGGRRWDEGSGMIEVVVTNTGEHAVFIDPWTLPEVSSRSGMLRDNVFQVTSSSGVSARYRGPLPMRDAEPANYKELSPARSIVYPVSIALNYDVSVEGIHRVEFSGVRYLRNPRESYTGLTASMVSGVMLEAGTGEVVDLYLSPAVADEAYVSIGTKSSSHQCSGQQLQEFTEEKDLAASAAEAAMWHLHDLWTYDFLFMPPWWEVKFEATPRYSYWFGADPPEVILNDLPDEDKYLMVMLAEIPRRLRSPDVSVTCHCLEYEGDDVKPVAYVFPTTLFEINTCPGYWQADTYPAFPDVNSRIGTLVHEATHFNANDVPGILTHHSITYGGSHNLAQFMRPLAIYNPDNYRFYVMNSEFGYYSTSASGPD